MKKHKRKQFYIICDCEIYISDTFVDELGHLRRRMPSVTMADVDSGQTVKKPILLYEDGTLEVQGITDARFKDCSRGKKWAQCYSYIKQYMDEYMDNRDRDVRCHFFPTNEPLKLISVLKQIPPNQEFIAVSELWKMYHRHRIEKTVIYEALWRLHLKLIRRDILLTFPYKTGI